MIGAIVQGIGTMTLISEQLLIAARLRSTKMHKATVVGSTKSLDVTVMASVCPRLVRPERWHFMERQFQDLQMPAQRWSAVDGRSLDFKALEETGLFGVNG